MDLFIDRNTPVSDGVLNIVAHLPTKSLLKTISADFFKRLTDADFMRIAVLLAQKSYEEGGCPIGGVVVNKSTGLIVGKGHNTLVQENHPYNHGETSAIRDAGSIDFSQTTMYTSLTPCTICTWLLIERGFRRVAIGNSPNATNNEALLQSQGLQVDFLPDQRGIELYSRYREENPDQDLIDWKGVAALARGKKPGG